MLRINAASGILFHSRFHFVLRNFSRISSDDPHLCIDSVLLQCRSGFRDLDIPISIFHQLDSFRPRPSIIVFNQLFTAMTKIRPNPPYSTVVTLENQLELSGLRPDMHCVGILAKCYCGLGRVDFAFSAMSKRLKLGYPPDIVIVTTLLNGLIVSGKLAVAVKLLGKVVKLALQPTLVTYGAMFKGLCRSGDNPGALKLLRNMELNGSCKPDVVIYNTIIDSLCKDGLLPQAFLLFKEMKIAPDVVTYNTLIDALCKEDKLQLAYHLFEEMQNQGVESNVVTYSSLLDGLFKRGEIDKAISLRREMEDNKVAPSLITYGIILDGLCEAGRLTEAREVFSFLKKVRLDVHMYTIMIKGLCKHGLLSDATKLLKEMVDNGCSPNACTYNTIIKGFLSTNDVGKALEYLHSMTSQGFTTNADNATLFIGLQSSCNLSDKDNALLQNYFQEHHGEAKKMDAANSDS